jgi:hypothetical protein
VKRPIAVLASALATLALAGTAQADPSEYGIESASGSVSNTQAGAHPDFNLTLKLKRDPEGHLPSTTRDLFFDLPPGLLANPNAVPKCTAAQLIGTDLNDPSNKTGCPQASQVGVIEVEIYGGGVEPQLPIFEPLYNMVPRHGEPARLGFIADIYPVMVDTRLRPEDGYGATAMVEGASSLAAVRAATNTLWGVPADESHDEQRITPYEAIHNNGAPETPDGKRHANLVPVPYMLNPTRCGQEQGVAITAVPYMLASLQAKAFAPLLPNSGCGVLDFEPDLSIAPTSSQAETGAGLDVNLSFPTEGLEHPNLLGEAEQKRAEVTLPEGVTVNPSQAVGLGVCSKAQFEAETASSGPNEGCPETAKIGSVSAASPLLEEEAEGSLYVAKPNQNPFGTLIALYMVLKAPERGVVVRLAGKVAPDPKTGQLVTTFGEPGYEIPQLPVSSFHLHFREGARSPLVTPPRCGTYTSTATFTSWAGQTVTIHPAFKVTSGVGGGPCPTGTPPFAPGFEAGSANDNAGAYSPFYMRLTRKDGDQDITRFSAKLPPGMVAKLAGTTRCPDAAIALAKTKTGLQEQASPSCPASSEIGHVLAGAGVGEVLTYATGKLYLAGPYQGAPLSVAAIVPAVAGPFDVGTVVTREALRIDPRTAEVEADGASSDPIPHILGGIPLKVRDIRVYVDRPAFTLNPTSCDPFETAATLWAGGNDVFSSADDTPHSLEARFQTVNCSRLGFKPRLALKLVGGTRRGSHPALTGSYRPRPGDANLAGMVLRLPHSAFLDQAHIRTICTRVQFAANGGAGAGCPAGSIYGEATAYTPLLAEPLKGPVFLRSSDHNLPDFVAELHGLVDVEAVARIDSAHGGIRATFSEVPDAPLTEVVVKMQGAKKGLIINSTDLCAAERRADVRMSAHNGKIAAGRPPVRASCGGKSRGGHGHR